MYSWDRERDKERAKNKAHLAAKKKAGIKRRNIWGQTCEYMCMLSDRPVFESEEDRAVRILDRQIHKINPYKK